MINEIDGVKLSNTIKNVNIKKFNGKKILVVNYLDGTKDHFDYTEGNYNAIVDKMEDQASKYVENKEQTKQKAKVKETKNLMAGFGVTSALCLSSVLLNNIGIDPIYANIALYSGIVTFPLTIASAVKIKNNANEDLKKYELFLNSQEALQSECARLSEKQRQLGNKKTNVSSVDITTVDNYTYKELFSRIEDLERYKEIDDDIEPKVKTLRK